MNYYEHHIGDFDQATAHLTACEDGIYSRLMRKCYSTEKPLPNDIPALQRLVRARTREEKAAVEAMLREFFELHADGWHQKRCDEEITRYQDKQAKARRSAEVRWSAQRSQCERNANASEGDMRTHCEGNALQTPDTRHQTPDVDSGPAPSATPPTPAPPFDGNNAEALNGKAIVPIALTWELPEQWGVDAEALGWKPQQVLREAEKFRQYWTAGRGQGTRRTVKGWRQTWSNWLDKAAKDAR